MTSGLDTLCWNEAVMSANHLVHESELACARATDIEGASLNSGRHDTDSDLREQSGIYPVNIEAVAQLARFYAAGNPPDGEFRSINERNNAISNDLPDKRDGAYLAPEESQKSREIRSRGITYDPHTADDGIDRRTETIREESDLSPAVQAPESSIRVVPRPPGFKDRFVSATILMRGQITNVTFFSFAAAIGLTICWHSREAKEIVSGWVLSMDWSLSASTSKSPPALATSSELLRRAAVPPEIAAARHGDSNHSNVQQERMYANGATTRGMKQNTRSKMSSPPVRSQENRIPTPVPETRWTTVEGWMLREVNNGAAVLEGPNGILTARRGDTVPGVGRVKSIVRWGERWIVATSRGLISTS
jgi:hypothetical protein